MQHWNLKHTQNKHEHCERDGNFEQKSSQGNTINLAIDLASSGMCVKSFVYNEYIVEKKYLKIAIFL